MTRYEHGFLMKCAEHGVDGRLVLLEMQKRAGIGRSARKLGIKTLRRLSPKVNPDKLNGFTRLFTKTRSYPVLDTPGYAFSAGYGPGGSVPNLLGIKSVTRLAPGRVATGAGAAGLTGLVASDLLSSERPAAAPVVENPGAVADVPKSGLSPMAKALLAALGIAGVGAAGSAAFGKSERDSAEDSRKKKKKKTSSDK